MEPQVPKPGPLNVDCCWVSRRDIQDILRIEKQSFERPWTEEDFLSARKKRNCSCLVAVYDNTVIGFIVFELCSDSVVIRRIAVLPPLRRRSVGSRLVQQLQSKARYQQREKVSFSYNENSLPPGASEFFESLGFKLEGRVIRLAYTV